MGLLLLYIKPNICKRKEPICTNGYNIGRRYVALRKKNKKRNTNLGKRKEPFWGIDQEGRVPTFPPLFPSPSHVDDPTRPDPAVVSAAGSPSPHVSGILELSSRSSLVASRFPSPKCSRNSHLCVASSGLQNSILSKTKKL